MSSLDAEKPSSNPAEDASKPDTNIEHETVIENGEAGVASSNAEKKTTGTDDTEESAESTARKTDEKDPPDSSTGDNGSSPKPSEDETNLSKRQMKRKLKAERMLEKKRQRKEQDKEVKLAKAKAEGRDIEAEKREMELRRQQGDGRASRNKKWEERFEREANKFHICIDCSFEDQMVEKEINSLASQIRYCYASNKKSRNPSRVTVTSLQGVTLSKLQNVSGFDQWSNRAFVCTDKDLMETHTDKSKICYLTSDATETVTTLEDDTVYVIGGIVDRNRLKRAAINRAEAAGVRTAKLPISEYFNLVTTKVLTCNHVFELMLKVSEHKGDWKKAFLDVLPNRKGAESKTDE